MPFKNYNGCTAEEYFWQNVNKNGPLPELRPDLGPCWIWTGNISPAGYGRFFYQGVPSQAHVYSFGVIHKRTTPEGMQRDHLCRNRACVNPDHLEAVTRKVNILRGECPQAMNARKTHCGTCETELMGQRKDGHRYCLACNLKRATEHYHTKVKPRQDKLREENGLDISDLPQNNASKTQCKRGHPLDGRTKDGRRFCLVCSKDASAAKYLRLKEAKTHMS